MVSRTTKPVSTTVLRYNCARAENGTFPGQVENLENYLVQLVVASFQSICVLYRLTMKMTLQHFRCFDCLCLKHKLSYQTQNLKFLTLVRSMPVTVQVQQAVGLPGLSHPGQTLLHIIKGQSVHSPLQDKPQLSPLSLLGRYICTVYDRTKLWVKYSDSLTLCSMPERL